MFGWFTPAHQISAILAVIRENAPTPLAIQKGFMMAAVTQYRCEICGIESSNPIHWFMIQCNSDELKVLKWNAEAAATPDARHYCGEAHAGVYISRWLEASCSPSIPDFNRPSAN